MSERKRRYLPRGTAEGRVRRRNYVSEQQILRRMREMWIDGFGLLPQGATEDQLQFTRRALQRISADDRFWDGLQKLCELRRAADLHRAVLKTAIPNVPKLQFGTKRKKGHKK